MQGSGIPQHSRNYYHKSNGNMAPMIFTLFSGKRFIAILMFNCFSKIRVNNWLKKMDKISHKLRFCVHLTENTKLHLVNRKNNLPACHKHAECPICTQDSSSDPKARGPHKTCGIHACHQKISLKQSYLQGWFVTAIVLAMAWYSVKL